MHLNHRANLVLELHLLLLYHSSSDLVAVVTQDGELFDLSDQWDHDLWRGNGLAHLLDLERSFAT